MDDGSTRSRLVMAGAAGLSLSGGVVALTLATAAGPHRVFAAVAYGLVVSVPVAVGVSVLARRPRDRFAWLLIGAGATWSLVSLSGSSDPVLYSLGRVGLWIAEAVLVYLLLAFPSGRLTTTTEWLVCGGVVLLAGLLYLPTALVVQHFPEPGPGTTCGLHCPANALALTGTDPGLVESFVRPLRETLLVVAAIAVTVLLVRRAGRAGSMMRRALIPVLATAAIWAVTAAVYALTRRADPTAASLEAIGWIFILALPLVALGFAAGLLTRQLYAATALERLAQRLRGHPAVGELRPALAASLEDPLLRIALRRSGEPGQWVDETGRPVAPPRPSAGTAVTEITEEGQPVVAIVHDAALAQDPALMQAAGSYALSVLENSRLVGRLRSALDDLSRSRARVVAVGDKVRRDIERDLHDGAQQRLVALRIELALQSERLQAQDAETAAILAALGQEVEDTIDDVRALARGIYPSVLADQGLAAALRVAARASPIPASVDMDGVGRLPPQVESTLYFVCLEALQNVAKHARGARHVTISLSADHALRFEILDDGDGFDERRTANGTGLTNLRDRLWAVGGDLAIESSPGQGTRVRASVPISADAAS